MKYAIIENEEFARINLRNVIETVKPEYECVFTAETVEECVRYFSSSPDAQLIFMDIELDDGDCFELFRNVKVNIPVIFTTAYDKYALKAFKVNSIDYLLKPISESDVLEALVKFENITAPRAASDYRQIAEDLSKKRTRHRMLINNGDVYSFIHTDEIAWFEAEDKYVSIVMKTGKKTLTDFASLGEILQVLDSNEFFQVSRSAVASISSISKISKYFKGRLRVELKAGDTTRIETVSAARRPEFLDWLGHTGRG